MLSLLARESYLLRQLISRVFSHLCSELTPQASHQILQVCYSSLFMCLNIPIKFLYLGFKSSI